jgi:hypothetical protein
LQVEEVVPDLEQMLEVAVVVPGVSLLYHSNLLVVLNTL